MNKIQKILKNFNYRFKNFIFASWFGVSNPWGSSSFTTFYGTISKVEIALNSIINVSALVAIIIIVYGAYLMIISGGEEGKIEQGVNTIKAGIVGLIIIFIAGMGIQWLVRDVLKM